MKESGGCWLVVDVFLVRQPVCAPQLAVQRTRTPNHKSPQHTTQEAREALKNEKKLIPVIKILPQEKKSQKDTTAMS